MKVSVITAVRNGAKTLRDCIQSVHNQTYPYIEHIIIDGGSTDGTVEVIKRYEDKVAYWVSEPDGGLYDAMNKGIKVATGDIVGILNSDDIYTDNSVIETVVNSLSQNNADSCYGDLVYVDRTDTDKIIRYWKAGSYSKDKFRKGWMPPHPTFFCKKVVYDRYGLLNLNFPLAADYELMLRFLYNYEVSTVYIPQVLVKMRTKGTSKPGLYTFKAIIENHRAWKVNKLNYPITLLLKPFSKVSQFVRK